MTWLHHGRRLKPDDFYSMKEKGNEHHLVLAVVRREHLGNYTCVAKNQMGMAEAQIEVSGKNIEVGFLVL